MINQERIILMTRMASYEENEGRECLAVLNYFRGDYIWFQILKSMICATLVFGVLFGMYIFYDFENFMLNIYKMDLLEFGKTILSKYLIVVLLYSAVSYAVYAVRYAKAKKNLKVYQNNLRKLSGMYDK